MRKDTIRSRARAEFALRTASSLPEARELYGAHRTELRRVALQDPKLTEMYDNLPHAKNPQSKQRLERSRQRAEYAVMHASSLQEARELFGTAPDSDWLREVVRRHPELQERYNELLKSSTAARSRAHIHRGERRRAILVENATDLAAAGESFPAAMRRLGYNTSGALEMALYRAKRPDLLAKLKANGR